MSARFRRCSPCNIFITPDDTHNLCVICLGVEHTRSALKGAGCAHCDHFTVKKVHLELTEELETGSSASSRTKNSPFPYLSPFLIQVVWR